MSSEFTGTTERRSHSTDTKRAYAKQKRQAIYSKAGYVTEARKISPFVVGTYELGRWVTNLTMDSRFKVTQTDSG